MAKKQRKRKMPWKWIIGGAAAIGGLIGIYELAKGAGSTATGEPITSTFVTGYAGYYIFMRTDGLYWAQVPSGMNLPNVAGNYASLSYLEQIISGQLAADLM